MTRDLNQLTEDSKPGTYVVTTSTGSMYEVVLDPDRATTIARRSASGQLYGGAEAMVADEISFVVGEHGRYLFWKAEVDRPDLEYYATVRATSPVVAIRRETSIVSDEIFVIPSHCTDVETLNLPPARVQIEYFGDEFGWIALAIIDRECLEQPLTGGREDVDLAIAQAQRWVRSGLPPEPLIDGA